uniref:Uncharacterized protein n=1 Tax=Stegastes partitus TaxID=144197 RepID=A0A3B5B996_9TELE
TWKDGSPECPQGPGCVRSTSELQPKVTNAWTSRLNCRQCVQRGETNQSCMLYVDPRLFLPVFEFPLLYNKYIRIFRISERVHHIKFFLPTKKAN